jgi:hypothetical protein
LTLVLAGILAVVVAGGSPASAAVGGAGIEGLAADRATGIGPGAAARRGARHVGGIERLAVERLAGLARLDAGAARHRAGIEGLAADRATGIGPGAAARHVEERGTSPASSASRFQNRKYAKAERLAVPHSDPGAGKDPRRRPSFQPASARRGGTARRGARHVAGIERLAVERLAGLAGLDPGAARHQAGPGDRRQARADIAPIVTPSRPTVSVSTKIDALL